VEESGVIPTRPESKRRKAIEKRDVNYQSLML